MLANLKNHSQKKGSFFFLKVFSNTVIPSLPYILNVYFCSKRIIDSVVYDSIYGYCHGISCQYLWNVGQRYQNIFLHRILSSFPLSHNHHYYHFNVNVKTFSMRWILISFNYFFLIQCGSN